MQPYGRLELANKGTVSLRAVPFTVGADRGVEDHLKYVAFSTKKFPVPDVGSVRVDAVINVKTPAQERKVLLPETELGAERPGFRDSLNFAIQISLHVS